jgi:hypothetical protein
MLSLAGQHRDWCIYTLGYWLVHPDPSRALQSFEKSQSEQVAAGTLGNSMQSDTCALAVADFAA